MFDIGIITAPRDKDMIGTTVPSIREAGFVEPIHVFAEPDTFIPNIDVEVHQNIERLGCFGNYHNALKWLIENGDKPYIVVLSDDFLYSKNTCVRLLSRLYDMEHDWGYHALYTPAGMRYLMKIKRGWNEVKGGWKKSYGGLYVFQRHIAEKIINHDFYVDHLANYKANQQIDHCIPEVCHQMGLEQYIHNPSFANHIGFQSTIGHNHTSRENGLNWKR